MLILRSILPWLLILLLAIINGALREGVLLKHLSSPAAFITSGLLLMVCIGAVALLAVRWMGVRTILQAALVGVFWLALTITFEVTYGFTRGQDLPTLLDAYRFKDGNIWPLVLVFVALSPLLAGYMRGILSSGRGP